MIKINYPDKKPALRTSGTKEQVFCMIRKRWVSLTPEEWVRQHFLLYMTEVLSYPASLIAVEKQLMLGDLRKRFDIVLFDKQAMPYMLVECKEMNVPLTGKVLDQVLRYNISIRAHYLVITNGSYCMACRYENGNAVLVEALPKA